MKAELEGSLVSETHLHSGTKTGREIHSRCRVDYNSSRLIFCQLISLAPSDRDADVKLTAVNNSS